MMHKDFWKSLQLYSIYRFVLASACLILGYQNKLQPVFGSFFQGIRNTESMFVLKLSLGYLVFALVALFMSLIQRPRYMIQAHVGIYCDIVVLILIMHACGGILSGMGLLLIVVAAAQSILSPGKLSFLTAALITFGLFGEHFYAASYLGNPLIASSQVGLLGLVVFATSLLTNFLSLRARKHQTIIQSQAKQLISSHQLNAFIVDLMQQGVIVLDDQQKIKIINHAALNMLQLKSSDGLLKLEHLPQAFQHCVFSWLLHRENLSPIELNPAAGHLRLEFRHLDAHQMPGLVIFMHNVQEETRKAQELKLSSLGHLTANIAHELRNPLGAASHAAQLLMESTQLKAEELSLAHMIQSNCERMNQVIKNVLSISGQKANVRTIDLNAWLSENLRQMKFPQFPNAEIECAQSTTAVWVKADPSQLMQIMVNLCENGLRYSEKKTGKQTLTIKTSLDTRNHTACLHVIDQGDGIPNEQQQYIFEPFYTTEKTGTGLGLYLARELSQMNGAYLTYARDPHGSQFQITFNYENNRQK